MEGKQSVLTKAKSIQQQASKSIIANKIAKNKSAQTKWHLLKNATFMLYLVNMFASSFHVTLTFIPAYALDHGITTAMASVLLVANGAADAIGRLSSGFLFDLPLRPEKRVHHSIVGIAAGVTVASFAWAHNFTQLLVVAIFFGFFKAMFSAQRTSIPYDFLAADDMASAVGLIIGAELLGSMLGPLLQGYIKDTYATYSLAFMIGGGLYIFVSLLFLMEYFVTRWFRDHSTTN